MIKILKFLLLPVMLVLLLTTTGLYSATVPSRQARNLWFSNVSNSSVKLNWTNGWGVGRIVVIQHDESDAPAWGTPSNGTTYSVGSTGNFTSDSNDALAPGKVVYNGSGSMNSVTLTNLPEASRIWCRVYEFNKKGEGPDPCYRNTTDLANPRDIRTPASLNPPTISTQNVRFATAELKWVDVSSATGYKLDVSTTSNFTTYVGDYQSLDIGNPSDGSNSLFQIEGLNPSTEYFARVKAYINSTESNYSTFVSFTTSANPGAPTFTIQYYANYYDAVYDNGNGHFGHNELTTSTNPPVIGATRLSLWGGTPPYYVKVTASHEMAFAPYVAIFVPSANNGNWDYDQASQYQAIQFAVDTVGGNYMPVYIFQRAVPTSINGQPQTFYYGFDEQWYFWGTDIINNQASAVTPTNPANQGNLTNNIPAIRISSPSVTYTQSGPVTDTVTYYGASSISLVNGNVSLNTTGTATGTVTVSNGTNTNDRIVSIGSITGNGTIRFSLAAGTATNSPHFDAAGTATDTTFINVDNTAPTVSITSPTASACVDGSTTSLTFTELDPVTAGYASGISSTKIRLNGGSAYNVTSGGLLNTLTGWGSISDGGSVTLTIIVTDNAGNVDSSTVTFSKDDTNPTLSVTNPSNSSCVNGTETLTFTSGYTGCVGTTQVQINSGTLYNITSGTALDALTDWSGVSDGATFTVTVIVTDGAGHIASHTISGLHKDVSNPTLSVTSPADLSCVDGNVTVIFTDGDPNSGCGVASVQARINAAAYATVTTNDALSTISGWNGVIEGASFTLDIKATDFAGHVTTVSRSLAKDDLDPTLTVTNPSNSACVTGAEALTFTYNYTGCAGSVKAKIDNGTYYDVTSGTLLSALTDWGIVNDGDLFTLTVKVTDNAGHVVSSTITGLHKDVTSPTLNVTSPTNLACVNATDVVSFTASDPNNGCGFADVLARINLSSYAAISNGDALSTVNGWSLVPAGGSFTLDIQVTDFAGHTTTVTRSLSKDLATPTVTINYPTTSMCINDTATLHFTVNGGCATIVYEARINSSAWATVANGALINTISGWNSIDDADAFTLSVRATNTNNNNIGSASVSLTKVVSNPTINFTSATNICVNASATFTFTTSATSCGVSSVQAKIGAGSYANVASGDAFSSVNGWSGITDGNAYTLYIKVIDFAGNSTTGTYNYTKDVTNPTASFTAPAASSYVKGTEVISFTDGDVGCGVNTIEAKIGSGSYSSVGSGVTTLSSIDGWSVASDGPITVTLKVTDFAGNWTTTTLGLFKDVTAPTANITAPNTDDCVNGTATITFTTSDGSGSGVSSTMAKIGAASYAAISSGNAFSTISGWGSAVDNSTFTVDFQITDVAGNVGTASKEFYKDVTAPNALINAPISGAYVNSAAIISFSFSDASTCGLTHQVSVDNTHWYTAISGLTTLGNITEFSSITNLTTFTLYLRVIDFAGNVGTASVSLTKDITPPTTVSITRTAGYTYTNASSVEFTVTFSKPVSGVTTSNFAINQSGLTGTSITGVTGTSPTDTWTVTVNTGTGDGTITINMDNTTGVTDHAGNSVTNVPYTAGQQYVIDRTNPVTNTLSPANGATGVNFTVTGCDPLSLALAFTEANTIVKGTGNILIKLTSTDATVKTIDVTSGNVTIASNIATITWTGDLLGNTQYYVIVPAGTFKDNAGNDFGGITSSSAWSFTTVNRATVPSLTGRSLTIPGRTAGTLTLSMNHGGGKSLIIGRKGLGTNTGDSLLIDNQFNECDLIGNVYSSATSFGTSTPFAYTYGRGSAAHPTNDMFVVYDGSATSVTITGLSGSTQYTFAMYAYNELGSDATTANYNLTPITAVRRTARITELGDGNAIAGQNDEIAMLPISPNPVVNNINFTFDLLNDNRVTVEIINSLGEVISVPINNIDYPAGESTISIPLMNVSAGTYMLRVSTPTDLVVQKFIYMP